MIPKKLKFDPFEMTTPMPADIAELESLFDDSPATSEPDSEYTKPIQRIDPGAFTALNSLLKNFFHTTESVPNYRITKRSLPLTPTQNREFYIRSYINSSKSCRLLLQFGEDVKTEVPSSNVIATSEVILSKREAKVLCTHIILATGRWPDTDERFDTRVDHLVRTYLGEMKVLPLRATLFDPSPEQFIPGSSSILCNSHAEAKELGAILFSSQVKENLHHVLKGFDDPEVAVRLRGILQTIQTQFAALEQECFILTTNGNDISILCADIGNESLLGRKKQLIEEDEHAEVEYTDIEETVLGETSHCFFKGIKICEIHE